ncbi:MAG: hypothetical protein DA330_05350 [Nitrososphaera sp.]|nr:hypothetical protein [Nitrososphaera sp.]
MRTNPRNKEGVVNIQIYKPLYDKIAKLADEQNITIKEYVNKFLEGHVITIELMRQRFSQIMQVGATDTAVLMQDKGKNVIASVTMQKNGDMHCSACKKDFCEHIFASLFSPSWITILQNMGKEDTLQSS